MGRDEYKPGDWNVICDQCGFKKKRSECRFTWEGLLVCADTCWEPRHQQDFVRAKPDRTRVSVSRPDTQTLQRSTTLGSTASQNATNITVSSASNISKGDGLGITLDNHTVQWTFASDDPSGTTVYLNNGLWDSAASGNTVYISSGTGFLTATEATATML